MAMAAALVATPAFARATPRASLLHPRTEPFSGPRNALEHGTHRGAFMHRRSCNFSACRSTASEPAAVAASGLSSSSRDGGACCAFICGSNAGASRNAADLGWQACAGGLLRLDVGTLSALRGTNGAAAPRRLLPLRISAEKPDLTNVAGAILRVGKQGLEAGTKFVPESVPRPVAQAGVGLAAVLLASFLLKSIFSTVTFILGIGALSYFAYFFFTKGENNSSSGKGGDGSSGKPNGTDEALEEARKIMEKYK